MAPTLHCRCPRMFSFFFTRSRCAIHTNPYNGICKEVKVLENIAIYMQCSHRTTKFDNFTSLSG